MRNLILIGSALLLILTLGIKLSGQEFHPEILKQVQPDSKVLFESRNGFRLPSSGVIRILIVFAEFDYVNGGDPTPQTGTKGWPAHSLPIWVNELTDVNPPTGNASGVITKYYQMASSDNYTVLGDYLLAPDNGGIFKVITDSAHSIIPSNAELIAAVNSKLGNNIITAHGLNGIDYFDLWACPENEYGLPKTTPSSESPRKYDNVVFIWRNSSFNGIGDYSYSSPGVLLGHDANTFCWFGTHENEPAQIMIHEYAHLIYGGMDFHCGGGGWFLGGDYWIPGIGGWSNLGLSGSSLLTWNAWDRQRLDWKATENLYTVSVRNETNTKEMNGDIDVTNPAQTGIYTLRDFVTTGDAIRIRLPFINPENEYPEYLWIENHNTVSLNGCQWDKFLWQDGNNCVQPAVYGLYAYMQIDREIRKGSLFDEVFKGFAYYLRPVTAEGFYDKEFEESAVPNDCINSSPMYPFARMPENSNPLTGSGDQEFYSVDWNNDNIIDHNDQYYTNIENIDGTYYKNMFNNGHTRNAFTKNGNSKIGISTNPASSTVMNMVGYDTPVTDAKNMRKIYLNGVSVEILNQNTDGTIQVQIRFDDTDVNNDVRWCADEIVLNHVSTTSGYSLNLKAGKTITLDRGTTATRMTNPMLFKSREVFTSPTVFNVQADAKMHLESNARVILKNASTLVMKSASSCIIEDGGIIEVEEGSTMIIEGNSSLAINGKGKLIVRAGATLCVSQDAMLTLQKGYENLELEAGVIIPAGCTDPTDGSGIHVSPNPATSNIVFDYVLQDENNSAELIISDAQGRTIDRITLNGKRGSKMLDTSNYSSGIYFYYTSGNYGKFIIK